jgi:hypothetical protein
MQQRNSVFSVAHGEKLFIGQSSVVKRQFAVILLEKVIVV